MKQKMISAGRALLFVVAFLMVSCVNRQIFFDSDDVPKATQVRPLKGFERIDIYGSPTVYYTQADTFSIRVVGPEDMLDKIVTSVKDGTLSIRNKGKIGVVNISLHDAERLAVYVTSPDLVGVQLNGSGDFVSDQRVDTDNLAIVLRGSGDVHFRDIICDRCLTDLIGSGDVDIDQLEAQSSSATLVGSGDIDIRQQRVRDTDISLKGSGDIKVFFGDGCQQVSCRLVGSGDITLKGKIEHLNKQKSGSGDIDTDKLTIEK